jgi:hypothetical protein
MADADFENARLPSGRFHSTIALNTQSEYSPSNKSASKEAFMKTLKAFMFAMAFLVGASPDNQSDSTKALDQRINALENRVDVLESRMSQYDALANAQRQQKLEDCVSQAGQAYKNYEISHSTADATGRLHIDSEASKDAREFWRIKLEACRTLYGRGIEVSSPTH